MKILEILALSSTGLLMVGATQASAQDMPQPPLPAAVAPGDDGQDIVVTAQRRTERLQDVPIAATAISGAELTARGAADIRDLATGLVPGLRIDTPYGNANPKITLRGIGNSSYSGNVETALALYLDELVLNPQASKLGQMFDLQRVEVLRGPQGTLYGKNSTAGAINFISRRPDGTTEGDVSGSVGRYGEYILTAGLQTAITDQLSIRVSGQRHYNDGYGFNLATNRRVQRVNDLAGRVGLIYDSGPFSAYVKVFGDRSTSDGFYAKTLGLNADGSSRADRSNRITGFVAPDDIDVVSSSQQKSFVRNYGTSANLSFELGGVTLSSITGYLNSLSDIRNDVDGSPADVLTLAPRVVARELSQELRLSSAPSTFSWIAGVSYFHQITNGDTSYSFSAVRLPNVRQFYREAIDSVAGFADATLTLGGGWSAFGGARLTSDRKEMRQFSSQSFIGSYDVTDARRWTKPTYRAGINYKPNTDSLYYASFNHGYRSGAFDTGLVTNSLKFLPANPEYVNNFEVGTKLALFNRRLRIAASAYYMQFKDQQVLVQGLNALNLCCQLANAGKSRIFGVEVEGAVKIGDNLAINFQGNALDSKYLDFNTGLVSHTGERLSNAPAYEVRLSPEYHRTLASGEVFLAPEIVFTGTQRRGTDFDTFGRDIVRPYNIINGQVGYRTLKNISTYVFVKNALNKRVLTDYLNLASFGFRQLFYNAPTTWGIGAALHF